ncbi:MAG: acyl-CoA dehydrogenase family protein [Deltaproteobacteria bacterium]|nr:acyl-CoA dehydrogenase family protein [Deltaproteobacteria bacterium]
MRNELDFLQVEDMIGDEERMIRDSVRAFVKEQALPTLVEHYRRGTFPRSLIQPMAELGLFGPTLADYGGAGVSELAYGLIMQELERGDSGLRSFCSVQSSLVIYPIHRFGSEQQRQRWLPSLIAGEAVGCFGLTEPDFGSNPAGMRTRARRVADGYVLDGTKRWITNGSIADVAVVFARNDEGEIQGFVVDTQTPGLTRREMSGKLSLRASATGELIFDECYLPDSALLPKGDGLKAALSCLNQARFGIAFGVVGAALACFDEALDYAKTRVQFGQPIAGFQLVQQELVESYNAIVQAQLLSLRLAELKGRGQASPVAISLAKRNNVAMALDVARRARDILGANGIVDDYGAMRHMCNLESVKTYEGTHNIHTLIVGQALTGIAAFSA